MIGRGTRLAAAVAAVALVGLAGPVSPAPAAVRPAAQAPEAVGIRALEQTAWVPAQGTWKLRVALTGAPAGSTVVATIHDRVADRSEYERSLLGVFDGDGFDTLPEMPVDGAELQPDGSRSVTLAVSLQQEAASNQPGWQFFSDGLRVGIYPIDVRVLDADGEERGRVVVHLNRVPTGDEAGADDPPITVAPLVTIGAGPTIDPKGKVDEDPGIARQVDDLTDGLAMGRGLPLTLVPRPESIEALARDEDDDSLTALQSAVSNRQVVDGTYVEVPIGSWIDLGLTDELSRQRDRGNAVLTEHLGRADSSTWDARGGLTPAAAAALWPVGVRRVILSSGALGPDPVTGPVTIAAGTNRMMEAVVPDVGLSGALARRDDPVLAAADFAAELALRAAATDAPLGVVLDPPDGWLDDPANVALLDQVLLDPLAPARPSTVAGLLDTVPNTGLRELAPTFPADLGDFPERLALARPRLSSYATLVGSGIPEVGRLDQLLLLAGSVDITEEERSAYVEEVLARTETYFQSVKAPDRRQTVTLTSSDGDVPLTLLNTLEVPATVTVDVRSNGGRIEIRGFERTQILRPGTNQLRIPVHTRAPGDSTIEVTVQTTDGVVIIDEVDYTVRSTAVPGIGIVLSVGAVVFLLVWWVRHWLRARRARGDGGGGGGGPDAPGPAPDDAPAAAAPRSPELVST